MSENITDDGVVWGTLQTIFISTRHIVNCCNKHVAPSGGHICNNRSLTYLVYSEVNWKTLNDLAMEQQ